MYYILYLLHQHLVGGQNISYTCSRLGAPAPSRRVAAKETEGVWGWAEYRRVANKKQKETGGFH
jgi:hypothetical protein